MSTTVVRYTTRPGKAEDNVALVEAVMAELAETRPPGLTYRVLRLDDDTFVHVADVVGPDNPLVHSPAFQAFTAQIGDRVQAPPVVLSATVAGSYP